MASNQQHREPQDRGHQRNQGRDEPGRKQSPGNGQSGQYEEEEYGARSNGADGSRRESASTEALDDEDASFDGYDAESPEAGRKSAERDGGMKQPPGKQSGSSRKH